MSMRDLGAFILSVGVLSMVSVNYGQHHFSNSILGAVASGLHTQAALGPVKRAHGNVLWHVLSHGMRSTMVSKIRDTKGK